MEFLQKLLTHPMTFKSFFGSSLAYLYNRWLTHLPVHLLRRVFLAVYLEAMGERTNVQMGCRFLNGRRVSLGKGNVINFGCVFDGRKSNISTGSNVSIGPEATILTLGHDPQSPGFQDKGGDVVIGDRAWIGYRAMILPGIVIGEGAVVGAGAVVTKDVAPFTVVAGNPARKISERNRDLNYILDYRPFLS